MVVKLYAPSDLGRFKACVGAMIPTSNDANLAMKKEGTVKEYQELFEMHVVPLMISEQQYLQGIFLNDLKGGGKN